MPWIQITINTMNTYAEAISELLSEIGAVSVTFQDTNDVPVYEPLPGETPLWKNTDVIALFSIETHLDELKYLLSERLAIYKNSQYRLEILEDRLWERVWLEDFRPMRFGKRLWICPSGYPIPDEKAVNVMLDPGLAFGTGTHPTTAMCLQWLDKQDLTGKTIIDIGCGSGILAIAALKLGASKAIGLDIDPQAITSTQENAIRNGVVERLQLFLIEDVPENMKANIVVANILAGPLYQLAPTIGAMLTTGGQLCLSGILTSQSENIFQHYQAQFVLSDPLEQEEWCCIQGIKR